jgi:hypothetical protein
MSSSPAGWKDCKIRTALAEGRFLQVWTKTAEKFPTWKEHTPLVAVCGTLSVHVGTKALEKFPTWLKRSIGWNSSDKASYFIEGR